MSSQEEIFINIKSTHDLAFQQVNLGDTSRLQNQCCLQDLDEELLLFLCECCSIYSMATPLSPRIVAKLEDVFTYRLVSGNGNFHFQLFDQTQSSEAEGKVCGHKFKNGDAVYRCANCQQDPTCVMCLKCFDHSNHEGHDVSFYITKFPIS